MPWAKLDDHYADHPKIIMVGPLAAWLNTAALTYCSRHLTDGFIPAGMVRCLADFSSIAVPGLDGWQRVDVTDLVTALLTHNVWCVCDGGYEIHDYLKYNPSREKVLREREKTAARVASSRAKAKAHAANGKPKDGNAVTSAVTSGATNGGVTPSPYPYPINTTSPNGEVAAAPKSSPKSTKTSPKTSKTAAEKPRDPNLDHPAVKIYRDMAHLTPDECQRAEIAAQVVDTVKWTGVIRAWLMHGNKKANVSGMLDWYRDGIPTYRNTGNGPNRQATAPAPKKAERTEYDNDAALARI